MTPNLLGYMIDEGKYGTELTGNYAAFPIKTNLFLVNAGLYIQMTVILMILYFPSYLIHRYCHPWVQTKFNGTFTNFKYSYFTRIWIQGFLDIGLFSTIGVLYSRLANNIQVADFIVSILCFISNIIGIIIIGYIVYHNSKQVIIDKAFIKKWGTFFDICDKYKNPNLYYILYCVKRLTIVYVITICTDPFLQLAFSFTSSLIVLFI